MFSRRDFLYKCGLTLAASAFSGILPLKASASSAWLGGWADNDPHDHMNSNFMDDPLPESAKGVKEPASTFCPGILRLKSSIHGESYEFRFRDEQGNYDEKMLSALNWFLRCKDGTWQYMDVNTIETLNYVSALLEIPVIQINSGYRSPSYNSWLAKKNENVARNSLHQYGMALDFSVPGMSIREVCSYTLYARNVMGHGGVGYYPRAGFVHLDSGKAKEWIR